MKFILFNVALWVMLSAATISAGAQKTYSQGVITYVSNLLGQDIQIREYFTTDSTATTFSAGPAITQIGD